MAQLLKFDPKFKVGDCVIVKSNNRLAKVLSYLQETPDYGWPILYNVVTYLDDRDKHNVAFVKEGGLTTIDNGAPSYEI